MKIVIETKYLNVLNSLFDIILKNPNITIEQLKNKVLEIHSINEEIIDEFIYYLLLKDCLSIAEPNKKYKNTKIMLVEKPEFELKECCIKEEYPRILMSLPPYNIFGLSTNLKKLDYPINTLKDEFLILFNNAKHTIKICSPFLEYKGFDIFLPTLLSKAKSGVDIKIIARQIAITDPDNRYDQIKKIMTIINRENIPISIRNYHYFKNEGIASSIHAKMIICDNEYAYLGSGELRNNSFDKNFEIGVILKGKNAHQLGEIFDSLFSVSTDIFIEEG